MRQRATSRAAEESIRPTAADLRTKILALIIARGSVGATCAEVEGLLGMRHQTASARICELHSIGYLADSGGRRLTTSGRKAIVWVATEAANR